VRAYFERNVRNKGQRLADLKRKTEELERRLSDARTTLEHELAQFAFSGHQAPGRRQERPGFAPANGRSGPDADRMSALYTLPDEAAGDGACSADGDHDPSGDRTETLVSQGRCSSPSGRLPLSRKIAIGTAVVAAGVVTAVLATSGSSPAWPASVARVERQAETACRNPDVRSEPGQVNFACAKATRQILWVFSLLTSGNNPGFTDARTGRLGLEPITRAQGGALAWSLNLHHPYDPANPVDSLAVAARAINNIIGGATVTGPSGKLVVQSGLESSPGNCLRYTGSAAITMRKGFPSLCASPVTSPQGQAALVADVYRRWMIGSGDQAAQDAAVLFSNAQDPGDPRVQAILKRLGSTPPTA
jgi:hypothetical protein